MSNYKTYRKYKDSGIEWLGKLPNDWILIKNRFAFRKGHNGYNKFDKTKVLSLTTRGVVVKKDLAFGKTADSYIGHQLVEKGDLVFTPRDFDQTPILSGIAPDNGCISNLYIVLKTKNNVDKNFVNYYWHGLKYKVDYFKNFSHGMRSSFNRFQFDEIPFLRPSLKEQSTIVCFLDKKTNEIQELINIKEKTIELLKERKTTIINQAVTKGLDSNIEKKDSGIEWLGEIPKHWKIIPLRYLGRNQNGISKDSSYFGSGLPFLSYGDVYNNRILPLNLKGLAKSTKSDRRAYSIEKGDIIFTRTSETVEEIGFASICTQTIQDATFSGFLIRFRPYKNRLDVNFSKYFFRSNIHRKFFVREMNIVIRASLSQGLLKEMPVVLPPLKEQKNIGDYLDLKTSKFDKLIFQTEKEIKLIKEYQQSLISEAVTGKIDVREQ